MFTIGPQLNTLVGMLTALLGLSIIRETEEVVEEIYEADNERLVVTDQHEYQLPLSVTLNPEVVIGATVSIFTPLSNTITILDNVQQPSWWKNYKFLPLPVQILDHNYQSAFIVYNKTITVPVKFGEKYAFEYTGKVTDEKAELYDDFPLVFGAGARFGDSIVEINFMDYIFENIIKNNLFLLNVNTGDIQVERLTSKALDLFIEALPANVFMIALFNTELDNSYLNDRMEEFLEFERGFGLEDNYVLAARAGDGQWGTLVFGSGVTFGSGAIFGSMEFQPQLVVMKRSYGCT